MEKRQENRARQKRTGKNRRRDERTWQDRAMQGEKDQEHGGGNRKAEGTGMKRIGLIGRRIDKA